MLFAVQPSAISVQSTVFPQFLIILSQSPCSNKQAYLPEAAVPHSARFLINLRQPRPAHQQNPRHQRAVPLVSNNNRATAAGPQSARFLINLRQPRSAYQQNPRHQRAVPLVSNNNRTTAIVPHSARFLINRRLFPSAHPQNLRNQRAFPLVSNNNRATAIVPHSARSLINRRLFPSHKNKSAFCEISYQSAVVPVRPSAKSAKSACEIACERTSVISKNILRKNI